MSNVDEVCAKEEEDIEISNSFSISMNQTSNICCSKEDGWLLLEDLQQKEQETDSIMRIDVGKNLKTETKTRYSNKNKDDSNLPSNQNNSCFANSVLVALFFEQNIATTSLFLASIIQAVNRPTQIIFGQSKKDDLKYRQKIQKQIIKFVQNLRNGDKKANCSELLTMLSKGKFLSNFADGKQHDAAEFFNALCECFGTHDNLNAMDMKVYGTNDLLNTPPQSSVLTTDVKNTTGITHYISSWQANSSIQENMKSKTDEILKEPFSSHNFFRVITETNFIASHIFCVHVDRTVTGELNQTALLLNNEISLNNRTFELFSAILHNGTIDGGHYTSLIKRNGLLYIYDDMKQSMVKNTVNIETVAQKAVLIFYVEKF